MSVIRVADQQVDVTLVPITDMGFGYWLAEIDSPFTGDSWVLEVKTAYKSGRKGYISRLNHQGTVRDLGFAETQRDIRQAAAMLVLGYEPEAAA